MKISRMLFLFTLVVMLVLVPTMTLAADVPYDVVAQNTSLDKIYPADRSQEIDCIYLTTPSWFYEGEIFSLTLSPGVIWYMSESDFDDLDIENIEWSSLSADNQTLELEVEDDCDEINLEGLKVAALPQAPMGDITVTLGGRFSGSAVVGEVTALIEISAEKNRIEPGSAGKAGDITIKETSPTSFIPVDNIFLRPDGEWFISVELPTSVSFAERPAVSVNGEPADVTLYGSCAWDKPGKLFGGQPSLKSGDQACYIKFNDYSIFRDGSRDTIKLSNLVYKVEEAADSGDINIAIGGGMINKLIGAGNEIAIDLEKDHFSAPVYRAVNAVTGQLIPSQGSMIIDSYLMSIDGVPYYMDIAPYIMNDRTYLPVRYVAQILGVRDEDIGWDESTRTVSLKRNGTTVNMQLDSLNLQVNGNDITMDAAPHIHRGRTMLPVRFLAEAFHAQVVWDQVKEQVTIINN